MCAVSMVYETGQKHYNDWQKLNSMPSPSINPFPWQHYYELIEIAKKYDELTGQKDCEDPTKAQFLEILREKLEKIQKNAIK